MCDDDKFILQFGAKRIEEEISQKHVDARMACIAVESNEVLQYLKNNAGSYLIFLDLDFGNGKLNGIDVAKQIKGICDNVKIVFVTNHREMAMQVLSSGVEPDTAGKCLVSAAEIDNKLYIAVVMGSSDNGRYTDTIKLYKCLEE